MKIIKIKTKFKEIGNGNLAEESLQSENWFLGKAKKIDKLIVKKERKGHFANTRNESDNYYY